MDCDNALKPEYQNWLSKTLSPYSAAEVCVFISALLIMYFLHLGISAVISAMNIIKEELKRHQELGKIWPYIKVDILSNTTVDGAVTPKRMATSFLRIGPCLLGYELLGICGVWLQNNESAPKA